MPTVTPKAGRLLVGVMSLPMLPGKTVLSDGGMVVGYAVLENLSSRFLWRIVRRDGNHESTIVKGNWNKLYVLSARSHPREHVFLG